MPQVDDYGYWSPPGGGLRSAFPVTPKPRPGIGPNGQVTSGGKPLPAYSTGPVNVGGVTPDYLALIKGTPGYQAWLASKNARTGTLGISRTEAIRQAILRHGGIAPGFSDAYGDIRPEDLAAAQGNQFSDEAIIQHNYEQGVAQMHRALAARGATQSGELGYGQGQADYAHGQAEYVSGNQFMDLVNQIVKDYTGGVEGINAEEPGIINDVTPGVMDLNPTIPAQSAAYVGGSQEQYGFPVYKDPDGVLWKMGPGGAVKFTPPTAPAQNPAVNAVNTIAAPGAKAAGAPVIQQSPAGPYVQVAGGRKYE